MYLSTAAHLSSQHVDPEHVQGLSSYVLCTHVDDTFHSEPSTGRSGGHSVLTRTRLGDDLGLSQSFSEQDLSDSVIDLVRTGVVQVFSPGDRQTRRSTSRNKGNAPLRTQTHFIQIFAPPAASVSLSAK
jgi:hypothetical protein